MKKVIALLVVVLVVCVVGGAFYTSNETQKNLNALRDLINANPGYKAEWASYDKGLFGTHAVLNLALKSGDAVDIEVPLTFDLKHGPLIFYKGIKQGRFAGSIKLAEEQSEALKQRIQATGDGPIWLAEVFMSLSGRLSVEDSSLPVEAQLASNNLLKADAYRGKGTLSPAGWFSYEGGVPSINYREDDATLMAAQDLKFAFSMDLSRRFADNMSPGGITLSVASVEGKGPEGEPISLKNLKTGTEIDLSDDAKLSDMRVVLGFDSFQGFGEDIDNASINLAFKNISVAFLEAYQKVMREMVDGDAANSSMVGMKLMGPAMSDLLPNGPIIEIQESGFTSKDGKLFINMKTELPKDNAAALSNPFAIIGALLMDAQIEVSKGLAQKWSAISARKKLVEANADSEEPVTEEELTAMARSQADMQLNMLVIQQFVVDSGDTYKSELKFKGGELTVNGQKMPLPFF